MSYRHHANGGQAKLLPSPPSKRQLKIRATRTRQTAPATPYGMRRKSVCETVLPSFNFTVKSTRFKVPDGVFAGQ